MRAIRIWQTKKKVISFSEDEYEKIFGAMPEIVTDEDEEDSSLTPSLTGVERGQKLQTKAPRYLSDYYRCFWTDVYERAFIITCNLSECLQDHNLVFWLDL